MIVLRIFVALCFGVPTILVFSAGCLCLMAAGTGWSHHPAAETIQVIFTGALLLPASALIAMLGAAICEAI